MTEEDAQTERIRRGGLPDSVLARLDELRGGLSSSFFSVPEYAAGAAAGIEPLGQVVGISTCTLRRGVIRRTRSASSWRDGRWHELTGHVQSWDTARRQAIGRLVESAGRLGGDAVLGVTIERREERSAQPPIVEVFLTGTAVKLAEPPRREQAIVALSSPQEFARLRHAGIDAVGLAGSFASVAVWPSQQTRRALLRRRSSPNMELEDFTIGVYEARRLAMERLRRDANAFGANGVVGVDLGDSLGDEKVSGEGMEVTVHAFGTAVRARVGGPATRPRPVLGLR